MRRAWLAPTEAGAATGETWLQELRALMPPRPLRRHEALRIAEWQAGRLREQLDLQDPALPTSSLLDLPFITAVIHRPRLPQSALLTKTDRGWVAVLSSDEPLVRRRFSLVHEVKHLLDDAAMSRRIGGLYCTGARDPNVLAEEVCDYFAACLLMPKLLLRRDWCDGRQKVADLAARYEVSTRAMERRLAQIGLHTSASRHP